MLWLGLEHVALRLDQRYPAACAKLRRLMSAAQRAEHKDKRYSVMRRFNSVSASNLMLCMLLLLSCVM